MAETFTSTIRETIRVSLATTWTQINLPKVNRKRIIEFLPITNEAFVSTLQTLSEGDAKGAVFQTLAADDDDWSDFTGLEKIFVLGTSSAILEVTVINGDRG